MAKAFIVRPFGTQEDIDFDKVETALIAPALRDCQIDGSTTLPFLQSGTSWPTCSSSLSALIL
jgi:hypothetical protein